MTQLDLFTLAVVPIELFFNNTELGHGTGFIWRIDDRNFLVTNWHVFSAKDFFTKENIRADAGRPNRIVARFNIHGQFWKQVWHIRIRDDEDRPLWLIHPHRGVDIAVLELHDDEEKRVVTLYPLNVLAVAPLKVAIGMEVFILGYPFKIEPPAFPVWKRGSIASEPQLSRLSSDYILVDTASRPGMSGSPVIRRSWTNHLMEDGTNRPLDATTLTRFIGVYSGRVPTDHPSEAQIGLVWDASFIDEIIAVNKRDE
jgi:S1-C subfamily serine protease